VRSDVMVQTHVFFSGKGYRHITTPCITGSNCEGDPLEMFDLVDDGAKPFFGPGTKPSLTVSGQMYAEAFAMAFGKVYTCGPTFHAKKSGSSMDLAEFWMVEPELIGDMDHVMDVAEAYVKTLVFSVTRMKDSLSFLDLPKDLFEIADPSKAFARITYRQALVLLNAEPTFAGQAIEWGIELGSEYEKWLASCFGGPVFVTNYPAKIKAFYMRQSRCNKESNYHGTVESFDLLVPGVGKLVRGSAREEDYDRLLTRLEEESLDPADYTAYLDLRRHGSLPHGGFGMGFERFVAWVTGVDDFREVTPYVRAYRCGLV